MTCLKIIFNMSKIAEHLERKLHLLDNVTINTNPETRYGLKIAKINRDILKCSIEVNGQDWDGEVKQFLNPFPDRKANYECLGSVLDNDTPQIYRTLDNTLQLEVTYN